LRVWLDLLSHFGKGIILVGNDDTNTATNTTNTNTNNTNTNTNREAQNFMTTYALTVDELPIICIIDPRTSAKTLMLKGFVSSDDLCMALGNTNTNTNTNTNINFNTSRVLRRK
jgi:hypothetical protein